jgi:hypothetical protein
MARISKDVLGGNIGAFIVYPAMRSIVRSALRAPHHEGPRSGHLAADLGGIFRIDLADHAVAAGALGGIEAGIRAFDQ